MRWLKAFFKKLFSFFSNPNKGPVQHKVAEQKSSELPKNPFFGKKKKKEVVHRIPPNYFTKPNKSIFRRGGGNVQEIIEWDGEFFPGRWRTRLIHHN